MILDPRKRAAHYDDRNFFVEDAKADDARRKAKHQWTDEEKRVFIEKFIQHPKNFKRIARAVKTKTIGECVHFYYTSGRTLELKRLLGTLGLRCGGLCCCCGLCCCGLCGCGF